MRDKKILYIDMDGVIVNFEESIHKINPNIIFGIDAGSPKFQNWNITEEYLMVQYYNS